LDAVDRGRDVAQEHDGVVIEAVERDPREQTRISFDPSRQHRRLAVPGGRDHTHKWSVRYAKPRDEVGLRNGTGAANGATSLNEVEGNVRDGHRAMLTPLTTHDLKPNSSREDDARSRRCSESSAMPSEPDSQRSILPPPTRRSGARSRRPSRTRLPIFPSRCERRRAHPMC
jgi:hypothetical protein